MARIGAARRRRVTTLYNAKCNEFVEGDGPEGNGSMFPLRSKGRLLIHGKSEVSFMKTMKRREPRLAVANATPLQKCNAGRANLLLISSI